MPPLIDYTLKIIVQAIKNEKKKKRTFIDDPLQFIKYVYNKAIVRGQTKINANHLYNTEY